VWVGSAGLEHRPTLNPHWVLAGQALLCIELSLEEQRQDISAATEMHVIYYCIIWAIAVEDTGHWDSPEALWNMETLLGGHLYNGDGIDGWLIHRVLQYSTRSI
jgi:hypothetical protein